MEKLIDKLHEFAVNQKDELLIIDTDYDTDGINVRFMNSNEQGDHITSEAQAAQLVQRIQFSGLVSIPP